MGSCLYKAQVLLPGIQLGPVNCHFLSPPLSIHQEYQLGLFEMKILLMMENHENIDVQDWDVSLQDSEPLENRDLPSSSLHDWSLCFSCRKQTQ